MPGYKLVVSAFLTKESINVVAIQVSLHLGLTFPISVNCGLVIVLATISSPLAVFASTDFPEESTLPIKIYRSLQSSYLDAPQPIFQYNNLIIQFKLNFTLNYLY